MFDLSGPIAALGVSLRNAYQMRFDEANEAGGIHGRKIRPVVQDTGYYPKKAVLATQKLIGRADPQRALGVVKRLHALNSSALPSIRG